MINKDTILSVYTDKQTLLEYLTKIETALDKAVLTSSQLVYEGGNNYHFKFVFEDGSSIETPSITLVQPISKVDFLANGNSVHFVFTLMDGETITTQTINLLKPVTAAAVRDGILYLTLSDGTEVSAGSITASFGASTFNGDVLVKGNLSVNGYMKQNSWEFDTQNGLGITLKTAAETAGFSIYYSHSRVSNEKLNIVIGVQLKHPTGISVTNIGYLNDSATIALPAEIYSKLYPAIGNKLGAKCETSAFVFDDSGNPISFATYKMLAIIDKGSSGNYFNIHLAMSDVVPDLATGNIIWRFEFNFILS